MKYEVTVKYLVEAENETKASSKVAKYQVDSVYCGEQMILNQTAEVKVTKVDIILVSEQ